MTVDVNLTIYGPSEDVAYWQECLDLIDILPSNIAVEYCGEIMPAQVSGVFAEHDVFVFPTRGENFGHVIFEALNAGTPVIVSDQTPWEADGSHALEVVPLTEESRYVATIERWASYGCDELAQHRQAALAYVKKHRDEAEVLEMNRQLFNKASQKNKDQAGSPGSKSISPN